MGEEEKAKRDKSALWEILRGHIEAGNIFYPPDQDGYIARATLLDGRALALRPKFYGGAQLLIGTG